MAEPAEVKAAREKVREREQAIWSNVENAGKELRARPAQQAVTQAERDVTGKKPTEGFGV